MIEKVVGEGVSKVIGDIHHVHWSRYDVTQLPDGAMVKAIAYIEPKIIRPEGAVWVPCGRHKDVQSLFVSGIGIVAEVEEGASWAIFKPDYNHTYLRSPEAAAVNCVRYLAEQRLYGFRLEGEQ